MIDLHSHTTASDGQHSPEELLSLARKAGVAILSVTDHDTVGGLERAAAAARAEGVELVDGIELSAFIHGKEIHVLGHFLDRGDPELARFSDRLRDERRDRMEQMVAKMRSLGYPVRMEQVLQLIGGAESRTQLGRPHLARVLVQQGWCATVQEAFDRFLADGRPAWVDRFRLSGEDAVALIRNAGGTATVAHPAVSRVDKHDLTALSRVGLAGLEADHSDHDPGTRDRLRGWARELDLVSTAGSDFHGDQVSPGRTLGCSPMAEDAFLALRARAASQKA